LTFTTNMATATKIYDASSAAQSAHRVAVEVTCSVDGLDAAPAGLVRSANR